MAARAPAPGDEAFDPSTQTSHRPSYPERPRLPILRLVSPLRNAVSQSQAEAATPAPSTMRPTPLGWSSHAPGPAAPAASLVVSRLLAIVIMTGLGLALLKGAWLLDGLMPETKGLLHLQSLSEIVTTWSGSTPAPDLACHGGKATSARWICMGGGDA